MTFRASLRPAAFIAAIALGSSLLAAAAATAQTATPVPPGSTPARTPATPAPAATSPARAVAPSPADGQAATPEQLFLAWDKDKNKMLTPDEFKNGWESAREQNIMGRIEAQFRAADKNKSGLIEATEFANLPLVKRAGAGAPPMSAFDANKDQLIDFKEYLDLVSAMLKRLAPAAK